MGGSAVTDTGDEVAVPRGSGITLAGETGGGGSSGSLSLCRSIAINSSSRVSVVVLNKWTPITDPWGQPPLTSRGLDHSLPTFTVMVLLVRKEAMILRTGVEAPFLL